LEVLEKNAEFKGAESDLSKALAYRRSICVLKCLPFKISHINQLKALKNIGKHVKSVIEVCFVFS